MMGSNRKRPFGYKMEFGEIVLHPEEAETVRRIYDSYLAGDSYSALVDKLRERGVPYDGDKPWNKNMTARILADRRYTGEDGFPQIIPEGQFRMVQVRRQERTAPCKKTPSTEGVAEAVRRRPPAWVELQVLGLLNRLIRYPELITCPASAGNSRRRQRSCAGSWTSSCAARRWMRSRPKVWPSGCPPSSWTPLGRRSMKPSASEGCSRGGFPWRSWNRSLLHESVRRITVSNGTVTVLLKNNQTLEGGKCT
ncbi:MAG: recombinase family protein [Flavonifractor plautii]